MMARVLLNSAPVHHLAQVRACLYVLAAVTSEAVATMDDTQDAAAGG